MKRRKIVKGHDHRGMRVTIDILVEDTEKRLDRDESERLAGTLADDAMTSIVGAPYLRIPLHKIEVK